MTAAPSTAGPAARSGLITRLPVFEAGRQVFGYELLFQPAVPAAAADDGSRALTDTLSAFGLNRLAEGRRVFVKFNRQALLQGHAYLLPREQGVIELPPADRPDDELLEACYRLRKDGYTLAAGCTEVAPPTEALLDLADIIKVDCRAAAAADPGSAAGRLSASGKRLLAGKVESWQQFQDALAAGFSYFQGPFFCRPEVVAAKELPPSRLAVMRLIAELGRPQVNTAAVEEVFKQDPPLTLKLLAYLNSSLIGRRYEVTSIRRAVVLLGLSNLRRWASLFSVGSLAEGRPPELFRVCLIRARFCELVTERALPSGPAFDLFLAGLLSGIDAILGRQQEELLGLLAVSDNVRRALAGDASPPGRVYALVRSYEDGDWDAVAAAAAALGLKGDGFVDDYLQALRWAAEACGQAGAS